MNIEFLLKLFFTIYSCVNNGEIAIWLPIMRFECRTKINFSCCAKQVPPTCCQPQGLLFQMHMLYVKLYNHFKVRYTTGWTSEMGKFWIVRTLLTKMLDFFRRRGVRSHPDGCPAGKQFVSPDDQVFPYHPLTMSLCLTCQTSLISANFILFYRRNSLRAALMFI